MTIDEFLKTFAAVAGQFSWHLTTAEAESRRGPFVAIRGYHKDTSYRCCPITAVDRRFDPDYYPEAAKALGLDDADAECIAFAADGDTCCPYPTLVRVRTRLLEITGLREPS